jgi:Protein of unknown function (DUF1115)
MDDEARERRAAECEFVTAAYAPNEAWVLAENPLLPTVEPNGTTALTIYRRLDGKSNNGSATTTFDDAVSFLLQLQLPIGYPISSCLKVSAAIEDGRTASNVLKTAHKALPQLVRRCQEYAQSSIGEAVVFSIFTLADEWIQDSWPAFLYDPDSTVADTPAALVACPSNRGNCKASSEKPLTLGRNLIYSHHIIGKTKRADMKALASELDLTGYCKIGWPGIIIIEGDEDSCRCFYDTIRRWNWQFLVLRGEMSEPVLPAGSTSDLNAQRKFGPFCEVSDMSIVASHCRSVGLESLFLTSMKVYDSSNATLGSDASSAAEDNAPLYGALVHVDHMNDGKSYRKWLRKACSDLDVTLLLQQCYRNDDFTSKRPLILVGIIGSTSAVSSMLKKWRTSLVDMDSRGQPCQERMTTVLTEGIIDDPTLIRSSCMTWDNLSSESQLNTTMEKLLGVVQSTGVQSWEEALSSL